MVLRRLFFRWLFPAAFVLPLWLFVGWIVFSGGSGWALLWLFVAVPAVFVSQLLLTLLIRARASVRESRAVSWRDLGGLGLWHVVIIALGLFDSRVFFPCSCCRSSARSCSSGRRSRRCGTRRAVR